MKKKNMADKIIDDWAQYKEDTEKESTMNQEDNTDSNREKVQNENETETKTPPRKKKPSKDKKEKNTRSSQQLADGDLRYWLPKALLVIIPVAGLIYLIIKAIKGQNRQLARAALIATVVVYAAISVLTFSGITSFLVRKTETFFHINSLYKEQETQKNETKENTTAKKQYSTEQTLRFTSAGVKIEFTAAEPVTLTDATAEKATFFTEGMKNNISVNLVHGQGKTTYTSEIIEKSGYKMLNTIEDPDAGYSGYYFYNPETKQYYIDVSDKNNEIMMTSTVKIKTLVISNEENKKE